MRSMLLSIAQSTSPIGWLARLSGITVSNVFLFITFLALTNEDPPQGPGIAVLGLLVFTLACCLLAWRWERLGGSLVILSAVALGSAAYMAGVAFGVGAFSLLVALIYCLPFLIVGGLFVGAGLAAGTVEI